ncbi:hypothetical protein [Anatilimnocola floriformis]|uniref:hypothetical protein n=1 Tax=Anatilimnocola floriformis TaxID=2948575 RepID=UPI0020C3BC78|nr:hypothetical protein [Anatilimnocola floriformis]
MPDRPQPLPLGPPQFGLRALLLGVSCLAVLLGLWNWMSPITFAALLLLILSVLAHVAGNVIGSRLRDGQAGRRVEQEKHEHITDLHEDHFAPVTKLGHRHSLGIMPIISATTGAIIGAAVGGGWTAVLIQRSFEWLPVIIATIAFGVLGGLGGFLTVGFIKALNDAWSEAANKD